MPPFLAELEFQWHGRKRFGASPPCPFLFPPFFYHHSWSFWLGFDYLGGVSPEIRRGLEAEGEVTSREVGTTVQTNVARNGSSYYSAQTLAWIPFEISLPGTWQSLANYPVLLKLSRSSAKVKIPRRR
jgi:hypothetical protein